MRKLGLVRAWDLHYSAGVQSVSRNEGEHETMGPLPMGTHRFIFLQLGGDGESSDCDEADNQASWQPGPWTLDRSPAVIRMQTDAGPRPGHCSQTRYFVLTILNLERNPSSSVEVFSALLPVTAEVPGSNLFNRAPSRHLALAIPA